MLNQISECTGVSEKEASKVLKAFSYLVMNEVERNGTVNLSGFGTFCLRERKERKGSSPYDGKEITIPAHKVPLFKAGKKFKAILNK